MIKNTLNYKIANNIPTQESHDPTTKFSLKGLLETFVNDP